MNPQAWLALAAVVDVVHAALGVVALTALALAVVVFVRAATARPGGGR